MEGIMNKQMNQHEQMSKKLTRETKEQIHWLTDKRKGQTERQ